MCDELTMYLPSGMVIVSLNTMHYFQLLLHMQCHVISYSPDELDFVFVASL